MISKFVCCCDCEYADICCAQDAYGGCINGKPKENLTTIFSNNQVKDNAKLNDN